MLNIQKAIFDGFMGGMIVFWGQTETMIDNVWGQSPWMQDGYKSIIKQWVDSNKKGCEEIKNMVDQAYANWDAYFSSTQMFDNLFNLLPVKPLFGGLRL